MKAEEMIVGTRVRCIYNGQGGKYYGKLATITKPVDLNVGLYWVRLDGDVKDNSWSELNDFELLVNTHYTVKAIFDSSQSFTNPTTRGHETWINESGVYFKEAKNRKRFSDINQAYAVAAKYSTLTPIRYVQFVVEETD